MISIVYCTRESNPKHYEHLRRSSGLGKNIEIIEVVNNGISLSKVYSEKIKEAKHDIVVFCHDDIIIETTSWGKKLIKHFNETDFGIIGLAGTTSITESGRWWDQKNLMVGIVNHQHEGKKWTSAYSGNFGKDVIETILTDGLFFAVKKDRLKYEFNEEVEGFHFYDLDFTFGNHVNGCKVGVMFDVRVTHLSIGQTNEQWEENRVKFVDKWKDNLPTEIEPKIIHEERKISIKKEPKLSVIIPTKGNVNLLKQCIDSIINNSSYSNIEIIIADTGSEDEELDEIRDYIKANVSVNIKLVEYTYYNFGKINNDVVNNHVSEDSELLLFCNNDIEIINDAISEMVDQYLKNKSRVGSLGARLHFGNNKVQHAGICAYYSVSKNAVMLGHYGINTNYGYQHGIKNVIGNTGAFLMVKKDLFNKVGQFNENYEECFEDVELNGRFILEGKDNIFVSDAVCYHYESSTRKKDDNKLQREQNDYMKKLVPFLGQNLESYKKYLIPIQ
jgi:GT2 family glycosyltransferase